MELRRPRKKYRGHVNDYGNPLPLCHSAVPMFSGVFNGSAVLVDSPDSVSLHSMGFFGKGTLSRGCPEFGESVETPPVVQSSQWTRRQEWISKLELASPEKPETSDGTELLVISDVPRDEIDLRLNPRIVTEKTETVREALALTIEEAFFLSYALSALQIFNLLGDPMPVNETWRAFQSDDFIQSYVAYHYFRSKGWVVKSGLKYGGDYLLYDKGPPFYHASYIVIIKSSKHCDRSRFTWAHLGALNRVAETVKKDVLICEVKWPENADLTTPSVLKEFKVSECLLRRWTPKGPDTN